DRLPPAPPPAQDAALANAKPVLEPVLRPPVQRASRAVALAGAGPTARFRLRCREVSEDDGRSGLAGDRAGRELGRREASAGSARANRAGWDIAASRSSTWFVRRGHDVALAGTRSPAIGHPARSV